MGHYLKKPRRYHGECCAQGGPNAETRGAAGPEGFGCGTSRGTALTLIPPRFFHKMSFLQHPGQVKRDLFQVGFGQWTPQGVHWTLYRARTANIGELNPNILVRDAIRMSDIQSSLYSAGCRRRLVRDGHLIVAT